MNMSERSPTPPPAPRRDVVDTYFGQEIVDPYRWIEEPLSKDLSAWLAAQNRFTRSFLEQLPGRAELVGAIPLCAE